MGGIVKMPHARGVSRMADNAKAVLVSFDVPLSDDQLRGLHEKINAARSDTEVAFADLQDIRRPAS